MNQQTLSCSICALLITISLCSAESLSPSQGAEEVVIKRVYDHLLICDKMAAVLEAKQALELFPDSKALQTSYVKALCAHGDEIQAWEQWQKHPQFFQNPLPDRHLLEMLAWGVLDKGGISNQLNIRLNALLGAAFTRDVKAVPLLVDHLRGSNAMLRSIAVKLSASYGDMPLKEELIRLLKEEKMWYVRLEVIRAIGHLRIESLRGDLKKIIANPKTLAEEKAVAMIALVSMYDTVELTELMRLIRSNRAGLRQLACEIITHLNLDCVHLIIPMIEDACPDVRLSVLNTLALLQIKEVKGIPVIDLISKAFTDSAPAVAMTAAWHALLLDPLVGEVQMTRWLTHEHIDYVRQASAALAISGKYGVSLGLKMVNQIQDPYAKANIALGLIGQRVRTQWCCQTLYEIFFAEKGTLWMWDSSFNPLFRSLAPSQVPHIEQIPHYPMVVDQMTRLEVLSVLSILRFPHAQDAVKSFLKTQAWGVTGAAAATLMQEGDDEGLIAVKGLLDDPDRNIRVQAALILALVGQDPSAVHVLQEAYAHVNREMKVHILEALAHIGAPESIPFLIEILKEPFQILRVVAASALIQCLYH